MELYKFVRPTELEKIIGNEDTIKKLRGFLDKNDFPHASLFHGPSGCGKTTLARMVASYLGSCTIAELDCADVTGIENVRNLREQARYKPLMGPAKVFILDECHKLTTAAQNALLKVLEDTPPHVYFMLCTTEPTKVLKTVRTRTTQFAVKALTVKQIESLLVRTLEGLETVQGSVGQDTIDMIAESCEGSARKALVELDSVLAMDEKDRDSAEITKIDEETAAIDLVRALMGRKSWKVVSKMLKEIEDEPETVRRIGMAYASSVLLNKMDQRAHVVLEEFSTPLYDSGKPGLVLACFRILHGE